MGGHEPILYWLNKYGRVISEENIENFGGPELKEKLAANGIYTWTVKPPVEPAAFTPTATCSAWRQTGNCDPKTGPREAASDEDCTATIAHGRSGYCECIGRPIIEFDCEHLEFTCESRCSAPVEAQEAATTAEEEGGSNTAGTGTSDEEGEEL